MSAPGSAPAWPPRSGYSRKKASLRTVSEAIKAVEKPLRWVLVPRKSKAFAGAPFYLIVPVARTTGSLHATPHSRRGAAQKGRSCAAAEYGSGLRAGFTDCSSRAAAPPVSTGVRFSAIHLPKIYLIRGAPTMPCIVGKNRLVMVFFPAHVREKTFRRKKAAVQRPFSYPKQRFSIFSIPACGSCAPATPAWRPGPGGACCPQRDPRCPVPPSGPPGGPPGNSPA